MKKFLMIAVFMFFTLSCVKQTRPTTSTSEEPVFVEETGAQGLTVTEDTTGLAIKQESTLAQETMPAETTAAETIKEMPEESKYGYRVQLGAFSNKELANQFAAQLRQNFTENVYVQYVSPFYKVRVGDFLTKDDAEKFKLKVWNLGFDDAFVVESKISK